MKFDAATESLDAAAYHEAGHTIAAAVHRLMLQHVELFPQPLVVDAEHVGHGLTTLRDVSKFDLLRRRAGIPELGIVGLGSAAWRQLFGYYVAGELAQRMAGYPLKAEQCDEREPARRCAQDLVELGLLPEGVDAALEEAERETYALLEERWAAVVRVATALLATNRLTSLQVRVLMRRCPTRSVQPTKRRRRARLAACNRLPAEA